VKKLASKGLLMSALICGNVLLGGNAVFAEDVQEYDLDAMVVTATRTMKQIQEVPASVSVVTAKDIERHNVTTIQEALQYVPGLYMNQAKAQDDQIMLRGMDTPNILVLVDGVQINSAYNGAVNFDQIPVESIERIEVLRGAASSIYGGRAVAGVINITTKEATDKLNGDVVLSYGSNNTWKKSLQARAKVNDKWSFGVGYENSSSDGYRGYYRTAKAKSGTGTYSANLPVLSDGKTYVYGGRGEKQWKTENYNFNVKYNFNDSQSLKYAFNRSESEKKYVNPFSYVKDAAGNPVYNGTVTTQNGNKITIKTKDFFGYDNIDIRNIHSLTYNDEKNNLNASFSYAKDQISGFTSPNSPTDINYTGAGDFSDHPGELYSLNIEKAWENVGNHTILVGGNYKQEEMIQHRFNLSKWHDRDSKINEYATDSGKVKNTALFVQDEYKMNDKVTMYAGLRYDNYKKGDGHFWKDGAYDTTSKGESYNELSPKLAFDFKADENTNYYVSYGHSFNPGPMYQIYRYGGSGMGAVIPNPALDPETSDTFEVGMKQKLSDNTKFGINLYRIETKDKIAYTYFYNAAGVCTHKQYINYNEEKRRGVEFELNHKFDSNWSAYLNYAWQTGKTSGAVIPGTNKNQAYSGVADYTVPKHLLHSGIEYRNDKLNVLLDCQYVSERMSPDSATGEYGAEDAFFIVNTGLNYKLAKDVTLQFGITNLLDKEFYCSEATAGRTYNVGLRYSF